jgi:hypothetical protein
MTRDADRVSLSGHDFRSERQHLAPHVFALGGDMPDPARDDLVSVEAWRDLIDLPTDVLLRTTSYAGGVVGHLRELISCWHEDGLSQVDSPELLPISFLDAEEELTASLFNAVHGYYRQGISCLRVAAENMVTAAADHLSNSQNQHSATKWSTALKVVRDIGFPDVTKTNRLKALGGSRGDWAYDLHEALSKHTHGIPGATSGDLWESNGPVFNRDALQLFLSLFEETLILLYVFRTIFFTGAKVGEGMVAVIRQIDENGHAAIIIIKRILGV